ncbi:uncharacterized protein B0H64DRAFT_422587 [Chaetomium fimeti]|uniref:Alcohol dehydrogenase-like N-terminal domain-containing protein n=1 Tax=Chaetomium fimeti TaxID=1854472 RepID=A0AAE0LVK8_9PEZI|nr:hypothetical protein B0H64DRAFT_422587 [Chaetomium fimeti]
MHRATGGLYLNNATTTTTTTTTTRTPFIMGSTFGGTVIALGSTPSHLSIGDRVIGFVQDGAPREAGFQEYVTVPTWKVSRVPHGMGLEAAVTVPTNLVTAVHTVAAELGLEVPWPVVSEEEKGGVGKKGTVLVWGAASSVGMYVLQVLRFWGYRDVLAVAAGRHHAVLEGMGARRCFDYRGGDVVWEIERYLDREGAGSREEGRPRVPYIVDCIGSREGTLRPLTKIAERGSKVAVMLPVINVHAGEGQEPELEMDVAKALPGQWKDGVELRGVRTFCYHENEFFKNHLQPEIIPALLEQGVVQPNKQRVVEGKTMLERAQKALDLLKDQAVSGEKLVWRVADGEI